MSQSEFPCQPFSKSGAQLGLEDTRGTVFHAIATILRDHLPAFVFLENVGNFPKHDGGNTWRRVSKILEEELGYDVIATNHIGQGSTGGLLSPHHLGYPHHRERFFIVGQRKQALATDSQFVKNLLKRPPEHSRVFPSARISGTLSSAASRLLDQKTKTTLISIISKEKTPSENAALIGSQISSDRVKCINHWGLLLSKLGEEDSRSGQYLWRDSMPSFPIWGYEIDPWQWYPIDDNPSRYAADIHDLSFRRRQLLLAAKDEVRRLSGGLVDLKRHPPSGKRSWLNKLTTPRIIDWVNSWPGYAGKRTEWPHWKRRFITQNREWAIKLWSTIDPIWLRRWLDTLYDDIGSASLQKLEWNCKGEDLEIWQHILQFRPSGLRVKRLAHVPALVAMTTTQIPIIPRLNLNEPITGGPDGALGRHLISSEGLELQGFPSTWHLPASRERAFTCLGNAVHVGVVHDIALNWLFSKEKSGETTSTQENLFAISPLTHPSDKTSPEIINLHRTYQN